MSSSETVNTNKINPKKLDRTKKAIAEFLTKKAGETGELAISKTRIIRVLKRDELLVREAFRQMEADGTLEIVRRANEFGMTLPNVYRLKGE